MIRRSLRRIVTVLVLLVAFVSQGTWALAGTTGGLTGTVVDAATNAPVAGAVVTVTSPSQTASGTTDASGHFGFLTLAPDTYTVSVTKDNYQPLSIPGQVVFADTVQTLTPRLQKALTTIAHVTATGAGSLVKAGTTADVYSVNATQQAGVAALGGGGSLNSAYSAVTTVPGAYVIPNQTGYYQTVHIRGGDYDQVGYEFDGVPVNRSFDNYPSSSASSLGNAEVQVYTGANPANSEGQGLAGYINQVIRTGTYPGFATGSLGIGTPSFYHRAAVEVGGSTPDRLFSYYVGIAGLNQSFNYVDNSNGAGYMNWLGAPLGFLPNANYAPQWYIGNLVGFGPSQIALGPVNWALLDSIYTRDTVINLHLGIQHHNDAGRDDVQLLYDNEWISNQFYEDSANVASSVCSGANAVSGPACAAYINGAPAGKLVPPAFGNGYTWNCPGAIGGVYNQAGLNAKNGCVTNYGFPNAINPGTQVSPATVPATDDDHSYNDTGIVKLQYTKNFGSSAFFRIYGYSFYSAWDPAGAYAYSFCDFVCAVPVSYNLDTHTRGLSAQFQDQVNAQNLVAIQGSYTDSTTMRDNNHFYLNGPNGSEAVVVNANNPYSGYCYAPTGGAVTNCLNSTVGLGYGYNVGPLTQNGTASGPASSCAIPGKPQYGTACSYMVAENGLNGTYSSVNPNFWAWSLTDQYRPSDKWLINAGIRLDTFAFFGANTLTPPIGGGGAAARQFWFNAYNLDNCINNQTGAPFANPTPGGTCPAGSHGAVVLNDSSQNLTYNIIQPRISGTYTIDPESVIRFSYGRYTEAPNSAFQQYNVRQEDLADYIGQNFLQYGRNTPGYPIVPPTSINYDLSFEQHLHGTDWSFKFTPFLRQTQDQIQQFFLNVKQAFVSGLNVGSQRSEGLEFQTQKGDFSRNGISGMLSFAYTNSYVKYGPIAAGASGTTVLGGVNTAIGTYNAYTKACVQNPKNINCGQTSNGLAANACYLNGTPVGGLPGGGCPAGAIANPYWNSGIQPLVNTAALFPTYDIFPGSTGIGAQGFGSPYVASMVLNYKHDRFAITPSFQFQGGSKYGYPLSSVGIDPASGCAPLAGYGDRYNANSCTNVINIPNPYTGAFDGVGAFTQPNEFMMNLQLSYEVSPRISLTGVLANIVNTCWGGTKTPWTYGNDGNVCAYANVTGNLDPVAPLGTPGAVVNPGQIIQSFEKYPYTPTLGPANDNSNSTKTPFQFYITANIKI